MAAQPRPTPSSIRELSPDDTTCDAKEDGKGGKKRCKQRRPETMTDDDDGSKRQARAPTYHFEKLLEETCPNHAYPIKHKLMDCSMMKTIMT
jgi:hypothetical protein